MPFKGYPTPYSDSFLIFSFSKSSRTTPLAQPVERETFRGAFPSEILRPGDRSPHGVNTFCFEILIRNAPDGHRTYKEFMVFCFSAAYSFPTLSKPKISPDFPLFSPTIIINSNSRSTVAHIRWLGCAFQHTFITFSLSSH